MLPFATWLVAPGIDAVVLYRLLDDRRLRSRYPLFCLCMAVTLTASLLLFVVDRFFPLLTYATAYFRLEMLTECFTCASLAEVCQRTFVERRIAPGFGKICQGLLASVGAVLAVAALIERNTPTIRTVMLIRNVI